MAREQQTQQPQGALALRDASHREDPVEALARDIYLRLASLAGTGMTPESVAAAAFEKSRAFYAYAKTRRQAEQTKEP